MQILGIETSCDETSVGIVEKNDETLSLKANVVASSLNLHSKTGGIIPENAAREQIKYMLPCLQQALEEAKVAITDIDAIAITYGPGLIGSLLVGVETAKTLAMVLDKPIIPVNHMIGHIYANWLEHTTITFPTLALIVSGGHTDLLFFEKHGKYKLLGGTRDDAAGEAFDKIARLLGFAYPGGPVIEEKAKKGDPKRFSFPRPLVGSADYDFSFSGLKTAVLREVKNQTTLDEQTICDIARATQDAISSVLVKKTLKAAKNYAVTSILLSGGVAANQTLRDTFQQAISKETPDIKFFTPSKKLCTDNGAMIAAAAFYNYHETSWENITANPELYFS